MKTFTRVEPTDTYKVGGAFKKPMVVKRFRTEDGQEHEFTTEGPEDRHCGAVLALTPDNRVVVSYQFRPGPEAWLYELPGGAFNEGEDFQAAALRELLEETGYESNEVTSLGEHCRGAYINGTWHYYLAQNCRLAADGPKRDELENDQGLETKLISIEVLIYNATHGLMTDPVAVLAAYETLKEIQYGTKSR